MLNHCKATRRQSRKGSGVTGVWVKRRGVFHDDDDDDDDTPLISIGVELSEVGTYLGGFLRLCLVDLRRQLRNPCVFPDLPDMPPSPVCSALHSQPPVRVCALLPAAHFLVLTPPETDMKTCVS